jgi:hypothetical protein
VHLIVILSNKLDLNQETRFTINARSLDFTKPKLFFKHIGHYAANSTYIHHRIPFNFSQILDTQQTITNTFNQLLAKLEQPFRSITKSTTDISLMTNAAMVNDFEYIIKALPQTTEISAPGRPRHFICHELLQCLQHYPTKL